MLSSNESELFYSMIGSTYLIDSLFLFVVSPSAFVGLLVNMLALGVLLRSRDRNFDLLHKYLVVYVFNNILLCTIISLSFVSFSPRFVPWFFGMFARIHKCILLDMVALNFLTLNRTLEVLILCQRLANFKAVFRRIGRANWSKTYVLIVIATLLINAPFYRNVKSDAELAHDLTHFNANVVFTYCARDAFYNHNWVNYSKTASTFVRDCVILIIELALSILLIKHFRRFLAAKTRVITSSFSSITNSHMSLMRCREAHFKRTTRTVAQFSVVSVFVNFITMIFFVVFALSYNNVVINQFLVVILFAIIAKPFLTILVLYKIDRNVRRVLSFRSK